MPDAVRAVKGEHSRLLTDEAALRHSHMSGDQSRSPGALLSTLRLIPGSAPSPLCSRRVHADTGQTRRTESAVYFTPQSKAAGERLKDSDRLFCVIKQHGFHVCLCGVETATHLHTMNHFFFFWQVAQNHPSCHCVRYALTAHTEKNRTHVLNEKSWAFLKLMIKLFTQWIAVIFQLRNEGNNYLGRSLSSLSTENPWGQAF